MGNSLWYCVIGMPQKAWTVLRAVHLYAFVSFDLRRYDMNGRSQMKGGKNWILPKDINANWFFWDSQWLEIWKNPLMSLYGTEWREWGYGLWGIQIQGGKNWILPKEMNANRFFWDSHWLKIWSNHLFSSMGTNGGSLAMDVKLSLFIRRYNTTELTCPTS